MINRLSILFALLLAWTAQGVTAAEIESGSIYRICTADGTAALTNGGSASNNVILKMKALDDSDMGQLWVISKGGDGYWQIKSSVGNVCMDNPSESHASWKYQLLQWQTSGGNNQKWTFEEAGDDCFYMIPYESTDKSKSYGYDDNGTFTYQTKGGDNTRVKLVKTTLAPEPRAKVTGFYAIQAVSVYPDYCYKADGKFLSFATNSAAKLDNNYSYANSRFVISTNESGEAYISLPSKLKYVYYSGTGLKLADYADETQTGSAGFVFFMNEDAFGLNTLVAMQAGTSDADALTESLPMVVPQATGTTITINSRSLAKAYCFRLVKLPAQDESEKLYDAIQEAKAALEKLSGDAAAALKSAIATAENELDYPYLTADDVTADVAELEDAVEKAAKESGLSLDGNPTGIESMTSLTEAVTITTDGGVVRVNGSTKGFTLHNAQGQLLPAGQPVNAGAYIVTRDGKSYKVSVQ